MERSVVRKLPDGSVRRVEPYHVCVKGLEDAVLCRDAEDYDLMVKTLAVCAWRNNVIIITYNVVSNHSHTAVLSHRQEEAQAFGEDCKKVYSMYFRRKYNEEGVLRRVKVKALWLDNPFYLRNTLAYIPRNALDNGCDIADYPWSGHRAMFRKGCPSGRPVSALTKRERRELLHTGNSLKGVPWLLDGEGRLIPHSICDYAYLEQAFDGDPAFYLRIIGSLNVAEMRYLLEEKPHLENDDPPARPCLRPQPRPHCLHPGQGQMSPWQAPRGSGPSAKVCCSYGLGLSSFLAKVCQIIGHCLLFSDIPCPCFMPSTHP